MTDSRTTGSQASWRDAVTIFVLCVTVYLVFAKGRPWVEATYQVERSDLLLTGHTLGARTPIVDFDFRGPDGRYYEVHGLLNTLVHVPVAAMESMLPAGRRLEARDFISSMSGVVLNSLTATVFYLLVRGLGITRRASILASVALAFGSIIFVYAGNNYEGNADVLALVLSAYFCFRFLRDAGPARARHLVWCGVACGTALLGRESNFSFVGLIGIAIAWDSWREKRIGPALRFAAAILPFVLLLGWYNWIRTGTPFETPITYRIGSGEYPSFEVRNPYGILALLLSPGGSVFVYSPVALLAIAGIREAWRRFPRETLIAGTFSIFTLVSTGLLPKWFGLSGWGPRYMNPTLPFVLIALAAWLDRPADALSKDGGEARFARRRNILLMFLVPGAFLQITAALVNWQGRLGYLVARPRMGESTLWSPLMFRVTSSQWWDAVAGLRANIGYMLTGQYPADALSHLSTALSASSRYTGMTVDTWWNRLMFEGLSPAVAGVYLAASAAIAAGCVMSLRKRQS